MKKLKMSKEIRRHLSGISDYKALIEQGCISVAFSKGENNQILPPMLFEQCLSESKKYLRRGYVLTLAIDGCGLEFELPSATEELQVEIDNLMIMPTNIIMREGITVCQYIFPKVDRSNAEKMLPELDNIVSGQLRLIDKVYSSDITEQKNVTLPLEKQVGLGKTLHMSKFAYLFGVTTWFQPVKLESQASDNFKLQKEHMPNLLHSFCSRVANQIPCPIDYVFTPLIVLLGSVIGHKIHLKPDADKTMLVASIVWGMYIGESGTGKTPALESVMVYLQFLIDRAREEYQKKHKNQQANNEVGKIEKALELETIKRGIRLAKEELDDTEYKKLVQQSKQLLKERNEQLSATVLRRYKTSNTTLPALLNILSNNPNGIAIVLDELKGFLARLSAKENEELRAFTLECARGFGSYDADRVTRNTISLRNMALSIVGGIQPDSFQPYLERIINNTSDNDGWIHRFSLITSPTPIVIIDPQLKSLSEELENAMRALFVGVDDSSFGFDNKSKLEDKYVTFSIEAQQIYNQWVLKNFEKCASKTMPPLMKSHLRKYDSILCAIALIYQIVMSLDKANLALKHFDKVSATALRKAIALLQYLEMHASRLFDKHISVTTENAKTLLDKLPTLNKMKFTAHEIAWREWAGMRRDTEAVTDALYLLEMHFYVRRVKQVKGKPGRSTTVWELNPLALV